MIKEKKKKAIHNDNVPLKHISKQKKKNTIINFKINFRIVGDYNSPLLACSESSRKRFMRDVEYLNHTIILANLS